VIQSYGLSDTGCIRTENEDRILLDDRLGLYILADGMGGHTHGEVAAELAVATIQYYIDSSLDRIDVTWPFGYNFTLSLNENRLGTAIQLGNRQVWKRSEQAPEFAGMGTTVVAALLDGGKAALASVGDSRIYLYRGGQLQQLTIDDTWVAAMIRQGTIGSQEALHHPMRNVLTQAAGSRESVEVHTLDHAFADQDLLLMSSDGLYGVVEEAAICSILAGAADLEKSAARLIQAARDAEAPDNVSCILIRYSSPPDRK
jgi:protein phosphatase